jgi:ankyrin repeat protein
MWASTNGHLEMVKALIAAGADVNVAASEVKFVRASVTFHK